MTVKVLENLYNSANDEQFFKIENLLSKYIPEVEKVRFEPTGDVKRIVVKEKGLEKPLPLAELSEGTRLVLAILTIIHQENPPSIICLEDLDKGLHPKLYSKIVQLCFDMTRGDNAPQIIATTHNPFLLNEFMDYKDHVILVEKENGETTFESIQDRINRLGLTEEELEGLSLGEAWTENWLQLIPQLA